MFRPVPMVQVKILLLRKDLDRAARRLAAESILHLDRTENLPAVHPWEEPGIEDWIGRLLRFAARVESLIHGLGGVPGRGEVLETDDFYRWEQIVADLESRLRRIDQRREELGRLNEHLELVTVFLAQLRDLNGASVDLRKFRWTRLAVGTLPLSEFSRLQEEDRYSHAYPFVREKHQVLAAFLTSGRHRLDLDRDLAAAGFRPLHLPGAFAGPYREEWLRAQDLLRKVRRHLARLNDKVDAIWMENRTRLQDYQCSANAEARLLEARRSFGFTDRAAILSGWVPRRRIGDLKRALRNICGERFSIRVAEAKGDQTPVQLYNAWAVRPFQKLLGVYGTPAYGEFEPTLLLAVGFLVMFGMMFGDLGQGLVLVALGWGVRRWTRYREEGVIVMEVGLFAAFFGILFGSFFGLEELFPPLWFSPMHDVAYLMSVALLFGISLILLGLLLRVFNTLREGGRLISVLTDPHGAAGIVFYGGAVLTAILYLRDIIPASASLWLLVPLTAVFFHPMVEEEGVDRQWGILVAKGVVEVMETVLGYLANTFSFLRVAAFGLAHVGLFMAVFALADRVQSAPLGDVWMVLVHLFGNAVMIALEGLIVSVQAVRLQFYEFFTKFFRGGGVAYHPFNLVSGVERRF
jgi:V/A-type H+/Na+-transporting ATPase subunit I